MFIFVMLTSFFSLFASLLWSIIHSSKGNRTTKQQSCCESLFETFTSWSAWSISNTWSSNASEDIPSCTILLSSSTLCPSINLSNSKMIRNKEYQYTQIVSKKLNLLKIWQFYGNFLVPTSFTQIYFFQDKGGYYINKTELVYINTFNDCILHSQNLVLQFHSCLYTCN